MMFTFKITYFKPSGKYYSGAIVDWDVASLDTQPDEPYIHDAISKLRGLRDNGGQGALPGLAGDGWDGPIHIVRVRPKPWMTTSSDPHTYYEDGVDHLLMPRSA